MNPGIAVSISALITALFPLTVSASPGPEAGAAPGAAEFNLLWQSFQVVLALSLTIALLIGTVWLFKKIMRMNRVSGVPGGAIRLLEIQYVDPKKAIALVKIMDRVLIIGWAENMVTLLGELTAEEAASLTVTRRVEPYMFGNLLARFIGRSSRPGRETENHRE